MIAVTVTIRCNWCGRHIVGNGIPIDARNLTTRIKANHTTIAAYLVTADARTLLRIRVEDNRNHGLPTTSAERIDHGLALIAAGVPQNEAARITGVPAPRLSVVAGCRRVAQRIEGLDGFERLPEASRYAMSQIDDDDVLHETATLVLDAALPAAEVRSLVAAITAVDASEALRIIGQAAVDHEDRIRDQAGNVRKVRTARATLDEALAVIGALSPADVFDSCPNDDVRAVLAQRITNVAAKVLAPTQRMLAGGKAS